jgi:membrane protease YdiL (CAAX protease family)
MAGQEATQRTGSVSLPLAILIVAVDMLIAGGSARAGSDSDLQVRIAIDIGIYALRAVSALSLIWLFRRGAGIDWCTFGIQMRKWRDDLRWSLAVVFVGAVGVTIVGVTVVAVLLSSGGHLPAPSGEEIDLLGIGAWHVRLPLLVEIAFLAVVAAPVAEELVYRGVLLPPLITRLGTVPAIVIDAIVFGFLHVVPYEHGGLAPMEVLGGLFMSIAFVRRRSLIAPIVVHAAGNAYLALAALAYVKLWEALPWAFA